MTTNQKTAIAQKAMPIIFANEGGYDSVNSNDNGAVSVGRIQWHAGRAKSLLQTICKKNQSNAKSILGVTLYNEIMGSASWNNRVVNQSETAKLKALLGTKESKDAQDSLALSDIVAYINKGISYGLSDEKALIYFADGVNQYGTGSSLWKRIAQQAVAKGGTLDAMFEATKANTSNYINRRQAVYTKLKAETTSVQQPVQKPASSSNSIKIVPDKTTIKMIQKWLNDYVDAGLVIDGSFGPKSKTGAVKAIQHYMNVTKNVGLVVDGSFGPKTSKACDYVSSSHNKKTDLAFIAQCLLYVNGYDPKGLDSSYGPDTTAAAKLYQSEHNLTADGETGPLTFKKLVL